MDSTFRNTPVSLLKSVVNGGNNITSTAPIAVDVTTELSVPVGSPSYAASPKVIEYFITSKRCFVAFADSSNNNKELC